MGNCFKKESAGKNQATGSGGKTKSIPGARNAAKDADLQAVFKQFDIDGDGYIQEEELRQVMTKMGQNPTDEEIKAMFKAADLNRDGKISFEEFIEISRANPLSLSLKTVFGELDLDGGGHITRVELKQAFERMGHKVGDADVDAIFRQADKNSDSKINFDEFVTMMCQRKV